MRGRYRDGAGGDPRARTASSKAPSPERWWPTASTISPSESREIGEALKAKGVEFLDAPCTGSTPGAEGGTLTFMIGGDQAVFEKIQPLLEPMGKKLYYCGGPGMGLQAKLTQNLILSNILKAFNEGMVLATKGGVDPELMLEILDNSAAKIGLDRLQGSFCLPPGLHHQLLREVDAQGHRTDAGIGKELGVPLPLTGLTHQLFQAAIAAGHGEEDICSTIKVLEDLTGVEVKSE